MKYRTMGTDPATRRAVSVLSLGAMSFGTTIDEATSFAILDRFAEAGGTFIDTSDNYAYWVNGTQGGESEELLGRWRRSRDRLGVDRLDLLYAHIEDPAVPLAETVEAFGALVAEGTVGLLGVSNHWSWRVERARNLAAAAGMPGYEVLQYYYSYLRPRTDLPGALSPDGEQGILTGELLSYARAEPQVTLVAYSPLLKGGYVRQDRPLHPIFDHSGTPGRLAALREVAKDAGATANQVVLAWLIGGQVPVIPLVGASSVAQLDESLAAADLELTAGQRGTLDAAAAE